MTAPADPPLGPLAVVRFAGELAMLAGLAVAGWWLGRGGVPGVLLAVALPVAAAVVWGRWVGPRAPRRLSDPRRLGVEVVLTLLATAGLLGAGHPWWAAVVVVLYVGGTAHGRRGG